MLEDKYTWNVVTAIIINVAFFSSAAFSGGSRYITSWLGEDVSYNSLNTWD